jgi:pyruvate dehydrogenase E2 component (dihydrolipoamide acetyltransferase)
MDVPILAVWGSEDEVVPASHADNLPDHARVEIIDGKGHSVQMEAAGRVNRLIEDFLDGLRS